MRKDALGKAWQALDANRDVAEWVGEVNGGENVEDECVDLESFADQRILEEELARPTLSVMLASHELSVWYCRTSRYSLSCEDRCRTLFTEPTWR